MNREPGKKHSKTTAPVILPFSRGDDPTLAGTGGSYRVIRLLGRGTMASVYLAEQVSMARPVALKILSSSLSSDPEFVERFLREARASARLNHPNIVAAFDFGEFQNRFYLAMEFIDGDSLATLLAGEGTMEEARVAGIGLQVIAALRHAHEHNVIHLDVKPANIMIRKDGRVKLADFGLAMILEHPGSAEASRKAVGTPYYMAPEQVEGGRLSWAADQFALGASLYEAVTGLKPFTGNSVPDILMKRFFEKPEPAWRAGRKAGKGFSAVLAKMMSRSPEGRYRSFDDLETDFRRVLDGEKPVVARPDAAARAGAGWAGASGNPGGGDAFGYGEVVLRVDGMLRSTRWRWVLSSSILFLCLLAVYAGAYARSLAGPQPPTVVRHGFLAEASAPPKRDIAAHARERWLLARNLMATAERNPTAGNVREAMEGYRRLAEDAGAGTTAYAAEARIRAADLAERLRTMEAEDSDQE